MKNVTLSILTIIMVCLFIIGCGDENPLYDTPEAYFDPSDQDTDNNPRNEITVNREYPCPLVTVETDTSLNQQMVCNQCVYKVISDNIIEQCFESMSEVDEPDFPCPSFGVQETDEDGERYTTRYMICPICTYKITSEKLFKACF